MRSEDKPQVAAPAADQPGEGQPLRTVIGLTPRALVISLVLSVGAAFWVRQSELIVSVSQVTESVPAIPAVAVLLLLVALMPVVRMIGKRFTLSRPEILAIYCFVVISASMSGPGVVRILITCMTVPFYNAPPGSPLETLGKALPSWLVVKNVQLIKDLYDGGKVHTVPWGAWIVPVTCWILFLMMLWVCLLCLIRIVQGHWLQSERLTFPIVKLPIEISQTAEHDGEPAFLKNPVMWAGFGLACLYNGLNIVNAFFPSLPCPGKFLDLSPFMTAQPWSSMGQIVLNYRPELIGFGFLVPSDICFSIWFFYILLRVEALVAHLFAWDFPGVPFDQEQSIGAYILLGIWLLWQVRQDFMRPVRTAIKERRWSGTEPPLWAVAGFVLSYVAVCLFCIRAGMAPWLSFVYLAIIVIVALVIARVRAAAGIPLIWLFPFFMQSKILVYVLGSAAFLTGGAKVSIAVFTLMMILSRGYFPAMIGYQIESMKIAEDVQIKRSNMTLTIILAAFVGLVIAFWIHLTTYYQYGAQNIAGMWMWFVGYMEFQTNGSFATSPHYPDVFRTLATTAGALTAGGLLLLRRSFVGCPLNPIGYAVATAFGGLVWWSLFVVWVVKGLVLRFGGIRLYRKAIPFFLGIAIGHFFAGGVVWGLFGAFWKDAARAYGVYFG